MSYGGSPIKSGMERAPSSMGQVDRSTADNALASSLDFASIDDLDPSLAEGFRVLYEREVPVELRSGEGGDSPAEAGALEAIRVKVLLAGDPAQPDLVRVELSSEADLFFHYVHSISAEAFKEVAEGQRLMVAFAEYPAVLLRMLAHCIRDPHSHLAVFVMQRSGDARLDFIQNMEFKFAELLSCKFVASPEEAVKQQVTFRYNAMKSKLALMQARLADIHSLVKVKSPSLLLQLQKTPPRLPGVGLPTGLGDKAVSLSRSASVLGSPLQRVQSSAGTIKAGIERGNSLAAFMQPQ